MMGHLKGASADVALGRMREGERGRGKTRENLGWGGRAGWTRWPHVHAPRKRRGGWLKRREGGGIEVIGVICIHCRESVSLNPNKAFCLKARPL